MLGRRRRAPLETFLADLRRGEGRDRIVYERLLPEEPAAYAEPSAPLPDALSKALAKFGVRRLYAHQARALDEVRAGRNVAIVTPTASGKTLAFFLPVLERLLADPSRRALFVYPTNALVHDQQRALEALLREIEHPPAVGVLTGATDGETRRAYRALPPQILLTNPELLHMSLLGADHAWAAFLRGLHYVVLDELHQYRGLFGSHLALTMRRLRRVAALHGASPQLIACSATIGNPGEVAERVGGAPFSVVQGGGAARGARTFMVWQPPLVAGVDGEQRAAAQTEAVRLFCLLVQRGFGTILFSLSRGAAESMSIQARDRLGPQLGARIAPYRNGYTARQRQEIEEGLKRGDLVGVVATNALEVGVDIGGLDAAVIAGYPGSKSSLWQQAGRAGRGTRPSLAVFIPHDRVVDAYFATHPESLLDGRFEDGVIDLGNPLVVASHLVCAAAERPLRRGDLQPFSSAAGRAAKAALADGRLRASPGGLVATGAQGHREVGLRGDGGEAYAISGPIGSLGSIDPLHLYREAFPGAVYLHGGARYRVRAVESEDRRVVVEPERAAMVTQPVVQTTVRVVDADAEEWLAAGGHELRSSRGRVLVFQTTTAYRERPLRSTGRSMLVPLPPGLAHELPTTGWWTVFPASLRREVEGGDTRRFLAGLHALEHVLPAAVSLRLLCDPRDVVAVYEEHHEALGGAALFLFDDRAGGAGIATRAAERAPEMFGAAFDIVRSCACKDGCPACVVSVTCWRPGDDAWKDAALALLARLRDATLSAPRKQAFPAAPPSPERLYPV